MKTESGVNEVLPVSLYGTESGGGVRAAAQNIDTRALITMAANLANLYAGDRFTTSYAAAIATNTTLTLLVATTASTKYTNLDIDVALACNCDIALYELTDAQAVAGTTSTVYNCNRNSAVTSSTTVTHTPSAVTVSTTILFSWHVGAATEIKIPTLRLAPSKKYYLLLTPQAAGTNTLGAVLTWDDVTSLT